MTVEAERFNGTTFTVILPAYVTDQDLNEQLKESDVAIAYEAVEKPSIWSQLLIGAFPLLPFVGYFLLIYEKYAGRCRRKRRSNDIW